MTKYLNVPKIKEKDYSIKYKDEPIFVIEQFSKLSLRIGKFKIAYYYRDRKQSIKLGEHPHLSLYEARQKAREIEGEVSVPEQYRDKKTLLESIYGNPELYCQNSYHSNEHIRESVLEGSYLAQYKDRTNTSSFIDKKNKIRLLADHYVDINNNCSITIDKLDGLEIKKIAEDYHLIDGKSALASKRLFNEWKTFFKWLSKNEGISNILADQEVSKVKVRVKRREYRDPRFKPEEVNSLTNSYEQMNEPYKWIHPFMMFTGRRMASVLRLEKTDIDFDKNIINFRADNEKMSMNNSDSIPPAYTEIPMCKSLESLVKDRILPFKPNNKFLFAHPTIKDIPLKVNDREMRDKVRQVTGIKNFTYKDIRTNVNTAMINLGIDLRIRQFILGQKSEKVESRELQQPRSLSVNEIFYDKNTHLEEKREALNKIEGLWIKFSEQNHKLDDKISETTEDDELSFILKKDSDLEIINDYLKSIKSKPITSISEYLTKRDRLHYEASDFMHCVTQFFLYKQYVDFLKAKKHFTSGVELYLKAFIYRQLKTNPNYHGRDYLKNWNKLQSLVAELPASHWKNKYDYEKLKIASQIHYYQGEYNNWKIKKEKPDWTKIKNYDPKEDGSKGELNDILSGKDGLNSAIERFNNTFLKDGKDPSPETLGHSKRVYLKYYESLKALDSIAFVQLYNYQLVADIPDEKFERMISSSERDAVKEMAKEL